MRRNVYIPSAAIALLILSGAVLLLRKSPGQRGQPDRPHRPAVQASAADPSSNLLVVAAQASRNFGVRKALLSPEERAGLDRKFSAQLKPAIEHWCKAYGGHLPFGPSAVTVANFRELISRNDAFTIYTFMIGGTTLCIRDSNGTAVVNYLFAPEAKQLSQIPNGSVPSTRIPVENDTVLRMVAEDTGTEFKAHEIRIKPTGLSSALNGGAAVDIAPLGGIKDNGLSKLSMVFSPSGELIYYDRDPTF